MHNPHSFKRPHWHQLGKHEQNTVADCMLHQKVKKSSSSDTSVWSPVSRKNGVVNIY